MKAHLSYLKKQEKGTLELSREIENFEGYTLPKERDRFEKSPPIYSPARQSFEDSHISERKNTSLASSSMKKDGRYANLSELSINQRLMQTEYIKTISPLKEVVEDRNDDLE